jgi:hypothetical protein
MGIVIILLIWLGIAVWVGTVAGNKGRSPVGWGLLGAVIGLFAFIPLLLAGTSKKGRLEAIREEEIARAQVRAELAQPAPRLPEEQS